MSPRVFPELLRIVKPGGILMWNIADRYDQINQEFENYDQIVDELRAEKKWDYYKPIQKFSRVVFSDGGAAYLGGRPETGLDAQGFIYTMKRL